MHSALNLNLLFAIEQGDFEGVQNIFESQNKPNFLNLNKNRISQIFNSVLEKTNNNLNSPLFIYLMKKFLEQVEASNGQTQHQNGYQEFLSNFITEYVIPFDNGSFETPEAQVLINLLIDYHFFDNGSVIINLAVAGKIEHLRYLYKHPKMRAKFDSWINSDKTLNLIHYIGMKVEQQSKSTTKALKCVIFLHKIGFVIQKQTFHYACHIDYQWTEFIYMFLSSYGVKWEPREMLEVVKSNILQPRQKLKFITLLREDGCEWCRDIFKDLSKSVVRRDLVETGEYTNLNLMKDLVKLECPVTVEELHSVMLMFMNDNKETFNYLEWFYNEFKVLPPYLANFGFAFPPNDNPEYRFEGNFNDFKDDNKLQDKRKKIEFCIEKGYPDLVKNDKCYNEPYNKYFSSHMVYYYDDIEFIQHFLKSFGWAPRSEWFISTINNGKKNLIKWLFRVEGLYEDFLSKCTCNNMLCSPNNTRRQIVDCKEYLLFSTLVLQNCKDVEWYNILLSNDVEFLLTRKFYSLLNQSLDLPNGMSPYFLENNPRWRTILFDVPVDCEQEISPRLRDLINNEHYRIQSVTEAVNESLEHIIPKDILKYVIDPMI
jgi:hypothetical protein